MNRRYQCCTRASSVSGRSSITEAGFMVMDERSPSNVSDQPQTIDLGAAGDMPSSSTTPSASKGGQWRPRQLIFSQYSSKVESSDKFQNHRVVVRRPVSDLLYSLQIYWIF